MNEPGEVMKVYLLKRLEAEYIQKAGYFVMLIPANDVTSLQIEVLSVTDMNKIKYEDFTTKMQALYKSIKGND